MMHAGWKPGTLGKTVNNTTCLQLKFNAQETYHLRLIGHDNLADAK